MLKHEDLARQTTARTRLRSRLMLGTRSLRELSRPASVAAILVIIAIGAYLRFRNLGQIPPGLHFDEAANGMDGLNVWKGQLHIFFPANNGREPLFLYLVAGAVRFFGNTALAVRLPAAMVGTLAIAATYALGRGLFRDWRALMAAGLVAVTFWTVALSRISYRANTLLVLFPLWLLCFWRCRDRNRLAPYLLAGLMLGLTQYTYTASRFIPILAVILALDWRKRLALRPLLAGAGIAALVAAPLYWAILMNPEQGALRMQQVWLFAREDPWRLLFLQLKQHVLMFGFAGDPIWLHNVPNRTPVFLPLALLFWVGVFTGWRTANTRALLWSVAVLLWPGILSVSNYPVPPDQLRVLQLAPAIFLLAASGLKVLVGRWQITAIILAAALVLADGVVSFRDYQRWGAARETYEQYDADMVVLAGEVAANPAITYLIPFSPAFGAEWVKYWTLEYLGNEPSNYILLHPPYSLPHLAADKLALVKWQAGMHLSADPLRRLDLGLDLAGWRETHEKSGQTYTLAFYTQQEPSTLVYTLPAGREYQGGFRILGIDLYDAKLEDGQRKLTGDLAWESGRYERPLSLSFRLTSPGSSAQVQADTWVLNAQGETASSWGAEEQGATLFEVVTPDLPSGEYELSVVPYFTDTLEPLEPIPSSDGYKLGTVHLP